MDEKNKKIVLFFLCNVQKPIRLSAMGLVAVGVQTAAAVSYFNYYKIMKLNIYESFLLNIYLFLIYYFLFQILKTSLSYFLMLRTLTNNQ